MKSGFVLFFILLVTDFRKKKTLNPNKFYAEDIYLTEAGESIRSTQVHTFVDFLIEKKKNKELSE